MSEILADYAETQALAWLELAAEEARRSPCLRRRCGSVLVAENGQIFGQAVNQPPPGAAVHCNPYCLPKGFKSDKTCCVHAEERSILKALEAGHPVRGSTMVFASVDVTGQRLPSGQPYCTICSKLALEAGVAWWILEHAEGVTRYAAGDYNRLSFEYDGEKA